MNILCTICSHLIIQAENMYVTKCGHVFHTYCLSQWISRSKTCPQCRNKVYKTRFMFRVYPTLVNEIPGVNAAMLQSRLDNTLLQLREQTEKFNEHKDRLIAALAQLQTIVPLILSKDEEIKNKDSTITALKEQLEYVKLQNEDVNKLKEENKSFKKNIQALNRALCESESKKNESRDRLQAVTQQLDFEKSRAIVLQAKLLALCESESKKNESRDRLQAVTQQLDFEKSRAIVLQAKLLATEEKAHAAQKKYESLKKKRKALEGPNRFFTNDSMTQSPSQTDET